MPPLRAAILSIGDELTLGQSLDTNAAWLAARLAERSVITTEHRTVADDRNAIGASISALSSSADVLIITGGLGPTADDLTREALRDVVSPDQELVEDRAAAAQLREWFGTRGRAMPPLNARQALRPVNMQCLSNANGTAPGLSGRLGQCLVFALPGPPREMQPMFLRHVVPAVNALKPTDETVLLTARVHEYGMGESDAAQRLGSMMDRNRNPLVGTTVSDSIVTAHIRAAGPRIAAISQLEKITAEIERAWQPFAFGREDATLSESVGTLLRKHDRKLVTAESCTGGGIGKAIVDRAGSSEYYLGGWVCYSNQMKSDQLGVPPAMIEQHGAVSPEVACAMARGALIHSRATDSLAITGIAGPDGGTPAKPVGTVHIARGERVQDTIHATSRHFCFSGDREVVRDRAVKSALQMLRFALLMVPPQTSLLWQVDESTTSRAAPDCLQEPASLR
jgi:nicotinamide-nucleotide amidase